MEYELEISYQNEKLKGILIKEDKNYLTLKLNSGYNANLKKSEVKIISKTKLNQEIKNNKSKIEINKDLPKVTILHTGGTIASKVDYRTGGVDSKFSPEELLSLYPELNKKVQIDAKLIFNIWSEDMRFEDYNVLLDEIEKAVKNKSNAIIISHGTDTLHYTSAALQYALENLPIPIILVGAQRSSDRPSSDAFSNLNAAIDFITKTIKDEKSFRRVGICMHENISDNSFLILDGINAKKMHSTRRDAFKQINYEPFARITKNKIEIIRENLLTKKPTKKLSCTKYDTKLKIGFFKAHPNLFAKEFEILSFYDAIILEGTGVGNIAEHESNIKKDGKNLKALNELNKKTKVIIGVQTVYGEVSLNIYSRGRDIQETGVLGNYLNLTTETLFCRTAHLLSKAKNKKEFEKLWNENLEGFQTRNIDIKEK